MMKGNTVKHPDGTRSDVIYDSQYGVVQYIRRVGKYTPDGPPERLHLVRLCHGIHDANYRDHVISVVDKTVTVGLTRGSFSNAVECARQGVLYSLFERRQGVK